MLQTNKVIDSSGTGSKVGPSHTLTDSEGALKLKLQCELKSLTNGKKVTYVRFTVYAC